ncbi:MAG: hypothetical protein ACK4FB_09535 [Brevundimonas sp.]|uniref:hypothetical protein n=1 Tax=Brevundimonas sp. TaxID=1871086 RepID=UPI00391AEADD
MRLTMSVTLSALLAAASLAACSEPNQPMNEAVNEDLNTAPMASQTEGANSFTEGQARGHIENAGYTNVSALTLTDSGLWQGTATRDGQTQNVSVDYRGAVSTTPEGAAAPMASDADAVTMPDQN